MVTRWLRSVEAATLTTALVIGSHAYAQSTPPDARERYAQLTSSGYAAFRARRFDEAVARYTEAQQLMSGRRAAALAAYIGEAQFHAGMDAEAWHTVLNCIAQADTVPPSDRDYHAYRQIRATCQRVLEQFRGRRSRTGNAPTYGAVQVALVGATNRTRAFVDRTELAPSLWRQPVPMPVGTVTLRATGRGEVSTERAVVVRGAVPLQVELRAPSPSAGRSGVRPDESQAAQRALVTVEVSPEAGRPAIILQGQDLPPVHWSRPIPVAPGRVELEAQWPDNALFRWSDRAEAGQLLRVEIPVMRRRQLALPTANAPWARISPVPWLLAGLGVATFLGAAISEPPRAAARGHLAMTCDFDAARNPQFLCPQLPDTERAADDLRTFTNAINAFVVIGAVLLVPGLLWGSIDVATIRRSNDARHAAQGRLAVVPRLNGLAVMGPW